MKSNQKIITLRSSRKSSLKRKSSIKRMYSTALIVCEGKNTEINYFKGLVSRLGIQANVDVKTTVRGSSPDNVQLQNYYEDKITICIRHPTKELTNEYMKSVRKQLGLK